MKKSDNMDYKEQFTNRKDFAVKFADAPFDSNGVLNNGWAEPSYDQFFTRMVDQPVLMNQSTVLPMSALQHDLDMLDIDLELESQRNLSTGVSYGLGDIGETSPSKIRKQLTAKPLVAKTIITDNFLEENIEKQGFMNTYVNLLADQMGGAFEKVSVFGDTTSNQSVPSGYKTMDGLLKQLVDIKNPSGSNYTNEGLSKLVYKDQIAEGVIGAVEQYIDNDGNLNNATMVLPPQIYSRLVSEIATDRETNWGDMVYQDGNVTKILGVEIKQDNLLRQSKNGYSSMKFTNGEYAKSGTSVDKMLYGFIGQPSNIVYGMMKDMEVKNQYDIDVLGYKVALLCKGDVKVLYDQDTIAVPFTLNSSA